MTDTKTTAEARKIADKVTDDCDHGIWITGYYGGDYNDYSHACEDCITEALEAVLARAAKAEATLTKIAAGSPPDDWEPYDNMGDYIGHGKYGDADFVDDADLSNNGDVHNHGFAMGLWSAAKIARAKLGDE